MAATTTVPIENPELFKQRALKWANKFSTVCLLNSNNYKQDAYSRISWRLVVDAVDFVSVKDLNERTDPFQQLADFLVSKSEDVYGFFSYDLKAHTHKLTDDLLSISQFPLLFFFQPRYVFNIHGNQLTVNRNYPETFEILEAISSIAIDEDETIVGPTTLKSCVEYDEYLHNVEQIRQQIEAGDFYELNYCINFTGNYTEINPGALYNLLNNKTEAPFSTYFKLNDQYLLCASPERFLQKDGSTLRSQPIKGTCAIGKTDAENIKLRNDLKSDEKERAENVMIVDLVRNDLAQVAEPGTVKVDELFGVYPFKTVQHMISTISATMKANLSVVKAIEHAFPMGSMTGAPKKAVIESISKYEKVKRGIYSGSVGYFTANGNFDFNVVIRSIVIDDANKFLSIQAGGAITYDSVPEKEWSEVQLKAAAMRSVL